MGYRKFTFAKRKNAERHRKLKTSKGRPLKRQHHIRNESVSEKVNYLNKK